MPRLRQAFLISAGRFSMVRMADESILFTFAAGTPRAINRLLCTFWRRRFAPALLISRVRNLLCNNLSVAISPPFLLRYELSGALCQLSPRGSSWNCYPGSRRAHVSSGELSVQARFFISATRASRLQKQAGSDNGQLRLEMRRPRRVLSELRRISRGRRSPELTCAQSRLSQRVALGGRAPIRRRAGILRLRRERRRPARPAQGSAEKP